MYQISIDEHSQASPWRSVVDALPSPAKHFFADAILQKVEVDPQSGYCKLLWKTSATPRDEWDELFCCQLRQHLPYLQQIEMCYESGMVQDSLEEQIAVSWPELAEEVGTIIPLSRAILLESQPKLLHEGGAFTLIVPVDNEPSLQLLEKRGCQVALSRAIMQQFGCRMAVRFVLEPKDHRRELEENDEELQRAVLKALSIRERREAAGDGVLLGQPIHEPPVILREIGSQEEDELIVQGEVLHVESRTLRSGRLMLQIDVTDFTDSITLKCFFPSDQSDSWTRIKPGAWLKAKGMQQYDRFVREPVLQCEHLMLIQAAKRLDQSPEKRVELHMHTKMSAMDALLDIERAIALLAEWGHQAVAVTDHGVVQAFPEAYAAGKKHGIKIIYGIEGYLYDASLERPRTNHVIILVRTQEGLRNLYKLVSLAHLEHFYRVPRISKQLLQENREGLIVGSACEAGELMRSIVAGEPDEKLLQIASFYDYLEIQPLANNGFMIDQGIVEDEEGLRRFNRKVLELGKILKKPVVATGDVHFLNPEDEIYRRILLAGKGMKDIERETPLYLRTTDEMLEEFSYLGEETAYEVVIRNPQRIAAQVEDVKPAPDGLFAPQIEGADREIRELSYQTARRKYGEELPEIVAERLDYELNSIIGNGYAGLYWIAHKLVKKSLDDGYLVGSRGSVGSSLVATMTGITEVNPLPPHWYCPECCWNQFVVDGSVGSGFDLPDKNCPNCGTALKKDGHDIPFAVFMGFEGNKVPDIDLNFSGEYQPRAHKYTEELLGKENVFRAGTISSIAERTAYGFVKGYASEHNTVLRNAEINRLVRGISGVKRTTGQHPGGLVVVPKGEDVFRFTPLQHPADDRSAETITTHFDYHSIDANLVKLDILGHDDPTMLRLLEDLTGVDVRSLPFDDPSTMALFSGLESLRISEEDAGGKTGALGIPEFGTRFVRGMLEETRPKTFAELVRISGLSHGTDVWLNNAQDLIKSGKTDLSGVISARDDIMVYLIYQGMERSRAFDIMERVRKGKGLRPEDEEAMRAVGVPEWYIESCAKIKYLFPKAHAVAYVMMAFRIAWFKVHRPAAYYAAYFSVRADDFDASVIEGGLSGLKRRLKELQQLGHEASAKDKGQMTILEVAIEMYARGIQFLPVDLESSQATRFSLEPEGLRLPFSAISGLGTVAAYNIVEAREQAPFRSRDDLRQRARLSRAVIDVLDQHGVLCNLPDSDQLGLFA